MSLGPRPSMQTAVSPCAVRAGCMAAVFAVVTSGCTSPVVVRPLATGRADTSAYVLQGSAPERVREEASRLCPGGGQVLLQSWRSEGSVQASADAGWWSQRWGDWQRLLRGSDTQAQLTVSCNSTPAQAQIAAAPPALPPASAPVATASGWAGLRPASGWSLATPMSFGWTLATPLRPSWDQHGEADTPATGMPMPVAEAITAMTEAAPQAPPQPAVKADTAVAGGKGATPSPAPASGPARAALRRSPPYPVLGY